MSEFTVLSLGAGVQSTALYLKFLRGEMPWKLDAAIFADTQEEPQTVYRHLAWLQSLNGPQILVGTAGKLGDDLMHGTNSTGQRFASIPAFTTADGGKTVGQTKRQCSKEYKTEVIGRVLRREVLGLQPKRRQNEVYWFARSLAFRSMRQDAPLAWNVTFLHQST